MKAALYILLIAVVQGTFGQYDPNIQNIIQNEESLYSSLPSTFDQTMRDFLPEVTSMFDSVMQQSLQTSNYDLICYLNGQNKYVPWYTNIAHRCTLDKQYIIANLTFWHNNFLAAIPALNQMFLDANSIFAARAGCGTNDIQTYAQSLGGNLSYAANTLYQLQSIDGMMYGLVPYNMLYGLSNELQMIFSTAKQDPTYDAISAIEDAEFRHLTIDSLTITTACDYAKWFFVGNTYAYYTTTLDSMRAQLEGAILRGANNFACTGQ